MGYYRRIIGNTLKEFLYIHTGYIRVYLHAPYNRKILYVHGSEYVCGFYDIMDLMWTFRENIWERKIG